jgi:hypothetical protein
MQNIRTAIPVIAFFLLLIACQKDPEITPVQTTNLSVVLAKVELLNITDLALEAKMETTSDQEIKYGFIVSEFETPTLERGKVIQVGAGKEPVSYSYVYSRLDTGKTYHIRAFAQLRDSTVYSQTYPFNTVAPSIIGVSPMEICNASPFYISTNLKNLSPDKQVSIYLDQHSLKLGPSFKNSSGSVYQAELPQGLQAGSYTLTIRIDCMLIAYQEKITILPGKWEKVMDLPFNNWYSTTTFVHDNWVYVLQYKSGKTEFFKQNYKTGDKVNLKPFGPQWFLRSPAIVVEQSKAHFLGGEEFNGSSFGNTTSKHFVYNLLNDSWSEEKEIPAEARVNAVSGIYENKLYFGLGYDLPPRSSIGAYKLKNDLWAYDLQTKQWEQLADFPQFGRNGCASFMVGPQLHIVGGYERYRANKENWSYDVRSNSWTRKSDYPGNGYTGFTGFSLDGSGYVGLGEIGIFATADTRVLYRTFFRYDPLADSWIRVSDFNGNVPLNKYTTADRNLGLMIGTDGLYSSGSLPVYTFIP